MSDMDGKRAGPARRVSERGLVITRTLDAPRTRVFDAWSSCDHLAHWWGPRDFTAPVCYVDFRPGGTYRTCIRSPDGTDHWMRGMYREIVRPERLAFTFAWEDDDDPGLESLVTVTLREHDGSTTLTLRQAEFDSVEERNSHQDGWTECLDRLAAYVANA